jgi:hypothetical protein
MRAGVTSFDYNAFISYKSTSRPVAERLQRDLYAIAKRHTGQAEFKIFLDTSHLAPGSLTEEIRAAVEQSRNFVVLLDEDTVESPWVAKEIAHWLATVGRSDRLFLVRADPDLDLRWNAETNGFAAPLGIPEPLRNAFEVEQKWVDFAGRPLLRSRDGLAGLCSKLMDVDPSEYLLQEATYQRRRARVITAVAVVMALLFAAATIGAVVAINSREEAQRNATRALAQADASEALLAVADSPTLAIELVLRAARQSDSPTVRSAMLAVSQAAGRLKRALVYPEQDTGHPATGARFSLDGTRLVAWGAGKAADTSYAGVWNLVTGALEAKVVVDAADLREVTLVGDGHLAGCSASGPVLVDIATAKTTRLDDGKNAICQVHQYATGVVLLGARSAYSLDAQGKVVTIDGVDSAAATTASPSAAVAGPSGISLLAAGRRRVVSTTPGASVVFADSQGGFLVKSGPRQYAVLTQKDGAPLLRPVEVPEAAVDVAPMLAFGHVTGDVAWMTDDGTIGWTRDDRRTKLENTQGEPAWLPYSTRLEPLAFEDFVAVYRNTAAVVRPPIEGVLVDAPRDTVPPNHENEWTQVVVPERIGLPKGDTDPIAARCEGQRKVLLHADGPDDSSLLVDGSAKGQRLTGIGQFAADCGVVDATGSLSVVPSGSSTGPLSLRASLAADRVVVSPIGDQVAVLKAGFPVEVLSTLAEDALPRPWDVTTAKGGAVTALGEREVFAQPGDLVVADGSGVVGRVAIPASASLVAAKPDGTGGVVAEVRPERLDVVDGQTVAKAVDACTGKTVRYLPGADFDRSYAAAQAQIPAARTGDGKFVDCRDGREVTWDPARDVLDYDMGQTAGRIVTRSADRVTVTTWTRGDESSLNTVDGPPLPAERGVATFDVTGQLGLTYSVGGRGVTLHRRAGGTWTSALSLSTRLSDVVAAQVVDGGSLVLAVSSTGTFEMFDVATGRLVAADLVKRFYPKPFARFAARRVGDNLVVGLHAADDPVSSTTIKIPVGVPALKRQLCSLYPAGECDR